MIPVTAEQMDLHPKDAGYPLIVINEGRVMRENLDLLGKTEKWLMGEIRKRGASSPKEVYTMTVDSQGRIYYAMKSNGVKSRMQ